MIDICYSEAIFKLSKRRKIENSRLDLTHTLYTLDKGLEKCQIIYYVPKTIIAKLLILTH